MKRGFIRAFWGVLPEDWTKELEDEYKIPKDNLFVKSREKTENIVKGRLLDKLTVPFVTYVFGKDNCRQLSKMGVENVVMVDENPVRYSPLNKRIWWHKLDILKYAMEEDGYDEIVYLDWDCYLTKELNNDFWETLNKKDHFQACLMRYKGGNRLDTRGSKSENNTVPNGGFVYIRGRDIPDKISQFRNIAPNKWLDEVAYAKYLDDMCGGWIGQEEYGKRFEPDACMFKRGLFRNKENNCFRHY